MMRFNKENLCNPIAVFKKKVCKLPACPPRSHSANFAGRYNGDRKIELKWGTPATFYVRAVPLADPKGVIHLNLDDTCVSCSCGQEPTILAMKMHTVTIPLLPLLATALAAPASLEKDDTPLPVLIWQVTTTAIARSYAAIHAHGKAFPCCHILLHLNLCK